MRVDLSCMYLSWSERGMCSKVLVRCSNKSLWSWWSHHCKLDGSVVGSVGVAEVVVVACVGLFVSCTQCEW